MSGVLGPLMVPVAQQEAHKAFEEICEILGVEERGHAALERLSALPAKKLVDAEDTWISRSNFWRPVIDPPCFAHDHITWDTIPSLRGQCEWVDSLIIGNTGFEGNTVPLGRAIPHAKELPSPHPRRSQ